MTELDQPEAGPPTHGPEMNVGRESTSPLSIEAMFARQPTSPPISGDQVGDETIEAFRYDREANLLSGCAHKADPTFDVALLFRDGSQTRGVPYDELAVSRRSGVRAPLRLHQACPERLRPATDAENAAFDELLDLHERKWKWRVRALLSDVAKSGHEIWLVGGPVRDTLRRTHASKVNDLDCTGTVPVGKLASFLEFRAVNAADRVRLSRGRAPVVRLLNPDSRHANFEYKPLELRHPDIRDSDGRVDPVSDHDLMHDAEGRDITINAIAYDPVRSLVIDAGGSGLADLVTPTLRPGRVAGELDPLRMFFRVLKFAARFQDFAPDTRPAACEIEKRSDAIRIAILDAANRNILRSNLRDRFYSDDEKFEADHGLNCFMAAARAVGSAEAVHLAELVVTAHA